jgi:hypothetical protein
MDIRLTPAVAQALRDGLKTQHRIPLHGNEQLDVGEVVSFYEFASKSQNRLVCSLSVLQINEAHLEDISDEDIVAEGYPNWTIYASEWSLAHKGMAVNWDMNPEVRVLHFANPA